MENTGSNLTHLSIAELAGLIKRRDVSPVEVAQALIDRASDVDPTLGAFVTPTFDRALEAAKSAEAEIAGGKYRGPLHGIPVAVKDIFHTAGVRTMSGSLVDAGFVPDEDATVVRLLREAGAYSLGKTHTCEFAFDPSGYNPHYGTPKNPWGLDRFPGGSSSGSAVAVASGMAPLALGSDTGGSVRIPAALCGLTGLKPTFGLVSKRGVTPLSWSLDTVGPLARSAMDAALAMNVLAGHDPGDPCSVDAPSRDFTAGIEQGVDGLVIGAPIDYVWSYMDADVAAAFEAAVGVLDRLGANVVETAIPELEAVPGIAAVITTAEAAALHADRVLAEGARFGAAVRRRIESGLFIPATAYVRAQRARVALTRAMRHALDHVDLLLTPAVPVPAPRQDAVRLTVGAADVPVREALLRLTRIFNVSRLPAVSVPCGFSAEGLPIGLQLAGRPFADALVLRAAHAYQQATDWHQQRPPL